MARIVSVATANPPYRYSQEELYELGARYFERYRAPLVRRLFMSGDIQHRHVSFDKATASLRESSDELHARFTDHVIATGRAAAARCLERAGRASREVDYVIGVTCTGYLCPGLSALLARGLDMGRHVARADLVGMGCSGAMPGLQRAFEFVRAYPDRRALVVASEVCSACYYVDDTLETVVGNAICADGAAAVLVESGAGPGPELCDFETVLEPAYIDAVGFQHRSGYLRVVLSKDLREAGGALAVEVVDALLSRARLARSDVRHWVVHSGGRKVIDSIERALGLAPAQLAPTRRVLRDYGNRSSPTVLFVLAETIDRCRPEPGDIGVLFALGPGLAAEGALIRF